MKSNNTPSALLSKSCIGIIIIAVLSLMSMSAGATTTVYLKFYFEGYLNGSSGMDPVRMNQTCPPPNSSTVTSLVTVELHSAISPYNFIEATTATLMTNGVCTATFAGTYTGSYYISIKHCNTLETWSALPVNISLLSSTQPYNFSTSLAKAYDNNLNDGIPPMSQSPSWYTPPNAFAFLQGDFNQDGNIGLADLVILLNGINDFLFGCICTDVNGDGNLDLLDVPIPEINLFQWTKRPY